MQCKDFLKDCKITGAMIGNTTRNTMYKVFCGLTLVFALLLSSCASLPQRLLSENIDTRKTAFEELNKIDDKSKTLLVPSLIKALGDGDCSVCKNAAETLVKIGRVAVPALMEALRNRNSSGHYHVANVLKKLGPETKDAVPALIEVLCDEDSNVRSYAAEALGAIGSEAKDAVPALIKTLGKIGFVNDRDACARDESVRALGKIGPVAVPALVKALGDSDSLAWENVAEALVKIGPVAVPELMEALRDSNSSVRAHAANVLEKLGPEAKDAVPALVKALGDKNSDVVDSAVAALKKIATREAIMAFDSYESKWLPALIGAVVVYKIYVDVLPGWNMN